jgi:lipoprotein-anchoring transpeptidase ErfK/SrfK
VPTSQVPQVFLVKQQKKDGWVQVLLPVRPNGSTGWVKEADVTPTPTPYRIGVKLADPTITVNKGSHVIYTGPSAIGATDPPLPDVGKPTPTPTGEYYLRILLQAPDPNTVYGPYAYGLSSHSDSLDEFAGGDAEIGIHGNNDASVLGTDATHGCIRMDNNAITMLAQQLPLGTPVTVAA